MGHCKYCERKGLFLFTDSNGLCKVCRPLVVPLILEHARIIDSSLDLAQNGKTLKTRTSRCDLILAHAREMLDFEARGIPTVSPGPSYLVEKFRRTRDEAICEEVDTIARKALSKAEVASTSRSKANALAAGLVKVRELSELLHDRSLAEKTERELITEKHRSTLNGYLEAARKAEFKGPFCI